MASDQRNRAPVLLPGHPSGTPGRRARMEEGLAGNVPYPLYTMAIAVISQVKHALSNLNPKEVRAAAERPVTIGLVGVSDESLGRMETFFAPPHLSPERRAQVARGLIRGSS